MQSRGFQPSPTRQGERRRKLPQDRKNRRVPFDTRKHSLVCRDCYSGQLCLTASFPIFRYGADIMPSGYCWHLAVRALSGIPFRHDEAAERRATFFTEAFSSASNRDLRPR
jgi:hypothetical protein